MVPPRCSFLTIARHSKPFSLTTFSSWWSDRWSEQQPFLLDVFGYIRKLSELRWYTGCKLFPYFFVLRSLSFDPVNHKRPVGFTNFEPQKPKLTYLSVTGEANCSIQRQSTPIRINFHLLVCALKTQKLHKRIGTKTFFTTIRLHFLTFFIYQYLISISSDICLSILFFD